MKLYGITKKLISKSESTCILIYSLHEPFLYVAQRLKKKNPSLKICLIQTDSVPGRNDMRRFMTKHAVKRGNKLVRLAKCCESFVVLSKYLVKPLEVAERPYLVTECICDEKQEQSKRTDGKNNIFLYTGTLDKEFGIIDMVDAFLKLSDMELWLCGDGNARDYIKTVSGVCNHIKYYGYVNQNQLKELRNQSDYLINPRRPTGSYTKYSFPSKTAEYMMSAKPIVMYKLEAIPDDYDKYLNYLTADTSEGMEKELRKIASRSYDELIRKAEQGREYLLQHRTKTKVCAKIVDFLKEQFL